jgi:hypothetical protein
MNSYRKCYDVLLERVQAGTPSHVPESTSGVEARFKLPVVPPGLDVGLTKIKYPTLQSFKDEHGQATKVELYMEDADGVKVKQLYKALGRDGQQVSIVGMSLINPTHS